MQQRLGLLIIFMIGFIAIAQVNAGEVYKWVDEDGNVHYSQTPPRHKSAKKINVKVLESSQSAEESPSQATQQSTKSTEKERKEDTSADEEALALKKSQARKQNCQIAMKRLATITAGGRLYEVNEKGERVYWDDDMRQAKTTEAQADVDKWCNEE